MNDLDVLISKKLIAACAALLFAGSPLAALTETRASYSATAFALDTDEVLYVEEHTEHWSDGRLTKREVRYEDPEGRLIAEKQLHYGANPEAPSFEMEDVRIGLREGAEVDSDTVVLFSGPAVERDRRRSVDRPENAVVDAGFDAFMRENFDAVAAGERIEFDFAVPAARRFFRFELVPQGEQSHRGDRALLVSMRPASMLLRLAVDPIQLVYSLDGRLLEFRGLANVCDEEGDRYKARIVFDYPDSGLSGLAAGAAL
ncbi:MAG: hypothetical protein OEM62_11790 [Acidobacteriota bacterium]|nr:hypothetical protein [Acidobacteriota bacterium]